MPYSSVAPVPPLLVADTASVGLVCLQVSALTSPGTTIVPTPASLEEVLHLIVGCLSSEVLTHLVDPTLAFFSSVTKQANGWPRVPDHFASHHRCWPSKNTLHMEVPSTGGVGSSERDLNSFKTDSG